MKLKKWLKKITAAVICFLMVFTLPLKSRSQSENAASSDPIEYVVEDLQGNVQVLEDGAKDWEAAVEGQVLESCDEIKTGDGSEATLMMQSETSVHVSPDSDMKVDEIEANPQGGFFSYLIVFAGDVLADVKKHLDESHSTFEVESSGVVCGVRGTAFEVTAQNGTAQVATHEGSVSVGNGTETHIVDAGNLSEFHGGKFAMQRRLDRNEIQRFQKWREFRQVVLKKRLQRLEDIRNHRRSVWVRRHPHSQKVLLKREQRKKRQLKRLEHREDR
jgi:ferric-dicitrate binding protein FerR (iron transport regulator)